MTARDVAYQVLLQVERADAYLNVALDAALKGAGVLPRQESALATELCYGVARRQLTLDAALAARASRPLSKLETGVLVGLRLGAYQLLFTRIPEHAAVGETVALMKRKGLTRAAGFVNAVLRKLSEDRAVPYPADPLERLSVEESHPLWLLRRWSARLGPAEVVALCQADNRPPPVCVRVNRLRATREEVLAALKEEGVTATAAALSPLGILLEDAGQLIQLKSFQRGLFQVQDEAAQLVSLAAGARPGQRVLDACAAPGGKTCHLAEQLAGQGEVVALDLHARKLERLRDEAERLGVSPWVRTLAADASRPLPFPPASFDTVLLDAPCSGLGTLRRHPELRYRRVEGDIARLAALQTSLIQNVVQYLRPGGLLVYAVCTPEPEEGEAHAATFRSLGLNPAPLPDPIPEAVRVSQSSLATWPHRHTADGFYAARYQRA